MWEKNAYEAATSRFVKFYKGGYQEKIVDRRSIFFKNR